MQLFSPDVTSARPRSKECSRFPAWSQSASNTPLRSFAHDCGSPFPWVGRQGRIHELENLLDAEDLDPADELVVREQLRALASEDLDVEEQTRRWKRVKKLAPGLLQKAGAQRIFESVATAAVPQQLGL